MLVVVDGDKSLVVADRTIISVAKRNMVGIVPLYYDMKKALPSQLNTETIYNGLSTAFTGSNIGQYSNSISKIWNSEEMISGTEEEKEEALTIIKILCMLNNYRIDFAKTLYMPEEPIEIKKRMQKFTKRNVPHFFVYSKDKEEPLVSKTNSSFVNKLETLIPSPNITIKKITDGKSKRVEQYDYRLLMNNPDRQIDTKGNPIVSKYCELARTYYLRTSAVDCSTEVLMKSNIKQQLVYGNIIKEVTTALSEFGLSDVDVADVLIKYLYCDNKNSGYKDLLWNCYGEIILNNLKSNKEKCNFSKDVQCVDCGEWFYVNKKDNNTCRCSECLTEHKKELKRLEVQRYRERKKMQSVGGVN